MPAATPQPALSALSALSALNRAAEAIWSAVSPLWPGFSVEVCASLPSTNTELMQRLRDGRTEPTLLVALEQTAGRGRRGRTWLSQPGDSLTFSLGLPLAPADWSGLSLAVGVGLAERLHPGVRLKWPNDLWWQGRKLGGVLVETAHHGGQRHAVIGVGLNLAVPDLAAAAPNPAPWPPAMAPAGLLEADPTRDAGDWLLATVPGLLEDMRRFESQGFAAFTARFEARDALQGLRVGTSDGALGRACGVGPNGALHLLGDDGQLREITSAEVSVRPC